jgi:zinc protease
MALFLGRNFRLVLTLLIGLAAAGVQAQRLPAGVTAVTSVEGIDEYRLPNGLQVLLVPDDSKPTTTVNLTYHVGSRHESYGETGMAHLLEHLMFKGSPRHPKVWADFTKRGLAANGSTSFDRTNYTASFSTNEDNLNWYLGWLADSMVNSFIARRDLDTEMTVVRNEMESGENSPQRILYQRTLSLMYDWHNYSHDTIGARADVENVDIARLQAFYRRYYQPDNATLIVAGKFDTAQVLHEVAGSFGKLPRPKRVLPILYTLDPAQDGERSVTLRRVGGTPQVMAAYHVPPGGHPDFAAVELLALVFGDVPSGRLHKRLTEQQRASATFGFASALYDPGFLLLGAQLAPGQSVDAARTALLASIESVAREPVSAEELERARTKWLSGWEQNFTNPEAVGISLSESVAQGDWRMFFLTRDRVRAVRLEDVQRVALQHLLPDNRTLATYLPTEQPQRAPAPARVDIAQTMKDFKPQVAAARVEAFEATPANIEARTQRFAIGGLRAALLPKGTRGQAVNAVLTLHFGDEKSLFGQGEAPGFVAALLDKGTGTLTRQQVQDRLDQLKTELSIGSGLGSVTVALSSRREHLPAALALVGEMLRRPSLPADAFDEQRRQWLAGIEQQRKEPEALAELAIDRHGNPYPRGDVRHERSFDEMVADVNALTLEQVRAFHTRFYGLAQAEFAAAGDMDVAQVKAALEAAFGGWSAAAPYARVPQPLVMPPATRIVIATPDKQNATLRARLPLPLSDNDADYPALSMANYLLGGGGNSRLWKRIRETEGLSYDVGSNVRWSSREQNSVWQATAIFAPQNGAKVEAALKEEIARALKDGFTAQELAEGQRGLLSFRRLSRAQDTAIAAGAARNLDLGRTWEISQRVDNAIGALTLAQVNAALRKYLKPENFVFALAGDFKP